LQLLIVGRWLRGSIAITSDAGALLLGAADPAIGLVDRLAGWFASGTATILPNPFGAMYDAGGTELAIFQDADVFTWGAYRFLYVKNAKSIGKPARRCRRR